MSVTNFIDSLDLKEEKGLEVRKIAEEQVIDRNEADKLIKEYEKSVFRTGETLELYDYVTAVEMLDEPMKFFIKEVLFKSFMYDVNETDTVNAD